MGKLVKLVICGSIIYLGASKYAHDYQRGPRRQYDVDLTGKQVIITGSSSGIGKETARELAKRNATIIFACRNQQKTAEVIEDIKNDTHNPNLHFIQLQLDDSNSVREFTKQYKSKFGKIDILINNAGLAIYSKQPIMNSQNQELTFVSNYLGPFLLTNSLLDYLKENSRIINVSSQVHQNVKEKVDFDKALIGQSYKNAYEISKYCNILFTNKLAEMAQDKKFKTVSLHPGVVNTPIFEKAVRDHPIWKHVAKIFSNLASIAFLNEKEGAMTTIYTALLPYEELENGGYYSGNQLWYYSPKIKELNQVDELWKWSQKILNLK